jgi:hypothetical protein
VRGGSWPIHGQPSDRHTASYGRSSDVASYARRAGCLGLASVRPLSHRRHHGDRCVLGVGVGTAASAGDPVPVAPCPRRRPSAPGHLAPDQVPKIKAGQPFLVEAAIQNTGDKAGRDTLINFVAPDCFELRQRGRPEAEPLPGVNDTAGLPPANRVVFFAPRAEPWTPVNWYLWPPLPSRRRTVRRARAEPRGQVACLPGSRRDVRDVMVMPVEGSRQAYERPEQSAGHGRSAPGWWAARWYRRVRGRVASRIAAGL